MFTGIVENTGEVKAVSNINRYKRAHTRIRINIGNLSKGLKIGDSMSVNGSCLTVMRKEGNTADFEMVKETIMRSSLGKLRIGDKVNLERSLNINGRLEGHIVLGHVDGSGQVSRIRKSTSQIKMWISTKNKAITDSLVSKGSITVDGISFTVVDVDRNMFSIIIIPHTLSVTTMGSKIVGDLVNLEIDVLFRYIKCLYHKTGRNQKYSKLFN